MNTIDGDIIKKALAGEFDVIIHGCNCFCTMGAGLAKGIKDAFPKAYEADCATTKGDKEKLGTCTFAECSIAGGTVTIVNAYTQYNYGRGRVQTDYEAIRQCLEWAVEKFRGKRIGLPKIGSGLGGGDWNIIQKIIEEEMSGENVTVVQY